MPRPLRRLSIPVPLAEELEALAATHGGVTEALDALLARATGRDPATGPLEPGAITKYTQAASVNRVPNKGEAIEIRLDKPSMQRLEEEAAKDHFTKAQWIAGLVRNRLHHTRQYNRGDNVRLKTICRDLADISQKLGKIARATQLHQISGKGSDATLKEFPSLCERVNRVLDELKAVDDHNQAYWAVDDAGPT